MRRATGIMIVSYLMLLAACGGNDEQPDVDIQTQFETTGDTEAEAKITDKTCTGFGDDGATCTDDDPCTKGEGICILGECDFADEQKYSCGTDKNPSACVGNGICDGKGGCIFELLDGWCQIDEECVGDGTEKPDNECEACVPEENRGGWTPLTGTSCEPEGNPCTTSGQCQQGFCVAKAGDQECANDSDCLAADDGDLCNGVYHCEQCACVFDEDTVVVCEQEDAGDCAATECNPETGECGLVPVADGTACDDSDPCTAQDYCLAGDCQSGETAPPVWTSAENINLSFITSVRVTGTTQPIIYAVGSGGVVYRSKNLGQAFEQSDIIAAGGDIGDWLWVTGTSTKSILAIFGDKLVVSNNNGLTYETKLEGCSALTRAATMASTFIAICGGQVQASADNGATWNAGGAIPLPAQARVTALAAKDAQLLYLGSADEDNMGRGYLYSSQDGGQSWNQVDPPERPDLAHVSHRGLLISQGSSDKLFVGYSNADGNAFQFGSVALFRSDDNGLTYVPLNPNLQAAALVPLELDSVGRLILGADTNISRGGAFGAGPWGLIPKLSANGILFRPISSGAVHPTNDFTFFVNAGNGVATAKDLGTTWELLSVGMNGGRFAVVASCDGGTALFAQERLSSALFKSTDGGASWQQVPLPEGAGGTQLTSLVCSPASENSVYGYGAAGDSLVSGNGGQIFTYQTEQTGAVLGSYNALESHPALPNTVFVSRLGMGLFSSSDGGLPGGSGFDPLDLPEAYVASMAADPFESDRMYVGSYATAASTTARVYACTNSGTSCSATLQTGVSVAGDGMVGYTVHADPTLQGRVYAVLGGTNAAVRYSNDHGESWQLLTELPFLSTRGRSELLPDAEAPGSLLAAFWMHPLYHWSQIDLDWTAVEGAPGPIASLARIPGAGNQILAGSGAEAAVYSSIDGGKSWNLSKDFSLTDYHVHRVVAESDYVFAVLQSKVHNLSKLFVRSGGQWSEGQVGTAINDVAVQQPENEVVLAAAKFGGLYMSQDGGLNFAPFGQLDGAALDLLVVPSDTSVVYAAVDCGLLPGWYDANETFLGSDCGVKRSIDGGETWFTVLNTGHACTSLALSEENQQFVVATCPGAGTYITTDGGSSWNSLSGWTHLSSANSVVIDGPYLYLGTSGHGVVRGQLNLADWTVSSNWETDFSSGARMLTPVKWAAVETDPGEPSRVFVSAYPGGLVRSDNFGSNWWYAGERLAPEAKEFDDPAGGPPMIPRFVNGPDGQELWVAVSGKGIFSSRDSGAHFLYDSAGSPPVGGAHPIALEVHQDYGGYAWLATREGVFRTSDMGLLWQKLDTGLPSVGVTALLRPNNAKVFVSVAGNGIYSIPFDGAAWQKIQSIEFFGRAAVGWGQRLFAQWPYALADPVQEKSVLVAVDPYGLFETKDGGVSYAQIGSDLPAGPLYGLARSPHNPDYVIIGTPFGPYDSTDGGQTFSASPGGANIGSCFSFAFDAGDANQVYALCSNKLAHGLSLDAETDFGTRKLYVTLDSGENWQAVGYGLTNAAHPVQVLADPFIDDLVFAVTLDAGVLRSEDGGTSFDAWNTGLPSPYSGGKGLLHSLPMTISPDGNNAVLGTDGFGFYYRILDAECQ